MKEIKEIIGAFELAEKAGQKAALATVVHVEGSSYRAPGARMLITEDGALTGAISGGCLEGDALRKALMAMLQGRPLLATYDTSDEDDAIIGVGLGCNGIIRVLIEPIDADNATNPIALLKLAVAKRDPAVLVTFFSLEDKWKENQGTRLLAKKDRAFIGNGLNDAIPSANELLECIQRVLENGDTEFIHIVSSNITAFVEYLMPNVSVIIAGAGNDVLPLVQMSGILGWEVTLIDGRPNYANESRFSGCQIVVSEPELALRNLTLDSRTACVLMTHNYNYDKALLRQLCDLPVPYIGMLGPKRKFQRMLAEFGNEGISLSAARLLQIHSPVGLNIGAETPEEIALSITAEISACFAGKEGTSLKNLPGRIHDRRTIIKVRGV